MRGTKVPFFYAPAYAFDLVPLDIVAEGIKEFPKLDTLV